MEFPGESTRDFYLEEAKVIYIEQIEEEMYKITGELASGEEILMYTSDAGHTMPFDFRIYTVNGKIVSVPYTDIERIEVDNTVTPEFETGKMATVTLRNGTVYKLPESALEYQGSKSIGYAPVADFRNEFPVRGAAGVEYVPFSAVKRIQLTPELIDFDALEEDTFPSPGTLTFRDGTEMSVDFAFGSAYGGYLSFFCPYRYIIQLRNNDFYYIGGPYMNENTISEILSIEFDA